MQKILVNTPSDAVNRMLEIREEERQEKHDQEEAAKNRNFTQVYPLAWEKIREFIDDGQPNAVKLYTFLAQNIDENTGAIVASQALLAEKLEVSVRTIKNLCVYLEKKNALVRINLGKGTVQAYCLNPEHVWKSFDNKKSYASFNTKTLARKEDNNEINRKLKVMMKEVEMQEETNPETDQELSFSISMIQKVQAEKETCAGLTPEIN